MRVMLMAVLPAMFVAGCSGSDTTSDFDGVCEVAGGSIVTAMQSCDEAYSEGRIILEEAGLVVETAPQSGFEAVLLATCLSNQGSGVPAATDSFREAATALDIEVCPSSLSRD